MSREPRRREPSRLRAVAQRYVLPGAVGLAAAAATAFPHTCSLERERERLDDAVSRAERELEAMPEEVREEIERFRASKARYEHRIAIVRELYSDQPELVASMEAVLVPLPDDVEWLRFHANRRQIAMLAEAGEPLPVVHLAERVAAGADFVLVDLERLVDGDEQPEQYVLSADFAERREDAAN